MGLPWPKNIAGSISDIAGIDGSAFHNCDLLLNFPVDVHQPELAEI
jgi:hypothetical protein